MTRWHFLTPEARKLDEEFAELMRIKAERLDPFITPEALKPDAPPEASEVLQHCVLALLMHNEQCIAELERQLSMLKRMHLQNRRSQA